MDNFRFWRPKFRVLRAASAFLSLPLSLLTSSPPARKFMATHKKGRMVVEPPKSPLLYFLWRMKYWFGSTFGIVLMEPWEQVLVCTCSTGSPPLIWHPHTHPRLHTVSTILFITVLITIGVVRYLPHQTMMMIRRARYYLSGQDAIPVADKIDSFFSPGRSSDL